MNLSEDTGPKRTTGKSLTYWLALGLLPAIALIAIPAGSLLLTGKAGGEEAITLAIFVLFACPLHFIVWSYAILRAHGAYSHLRFVGLILAIGFINIFVSGAGCGMLGWF